MKFGHIIEIAGLNLKDYLELSSVAVEVFDRKNRKITRNMNFPNPLFANNLDSEKKFATFLEEENRKCLTDSINMIRVRFTDGFLVLYYPPNCNPKGLFKF